MCQEKKLCQLKEGEYGIVTKINLGGAIQRRLFDLGLIPGTSVQNLYAAPSGSPIAFRIRGACIALRKRDCEHIFLRMGTPWQ